MNWTDSIPYIIVLAVLFIVENIYFKIADTYNIIDKPNERSSHTKITLRGGGIIFPLSILLWSISSFLFPDYIHTEHQYYLFIIGLCAISTISFVDDCVTLPNRYRLPVHFIAVILLFTQLGVFDLPLWIFPIALIVVVGIINAVNFMDGINGITVGYGLVTLVTLLYINHFIVEFVDTSLMLYAILGLLIFAFYNFRTKAKAFAGDVGSISLAFILCFFIGKLIITTNNPLWIFLLSVYGIDTIVTIIHRLYLKQNIFEAHRFHLYQLMVHQAKLKHITVSLIYMLFSILISSILIYNIMFFFIVFICMIILYITVRIKLVPKIDAI